MLSKALRMPDWPNVFQPIVEGNSLHAGTDTQSPQDVGHISIRLGSVRFRTLLWADVLLLPDHMRLVVMDIVAEGDARLVLLVS